MTTPSRPSDAGDADRRADPASVGGALEAGIEFERPNAARLYVFYRGGAHNFSADRELARQVLANTPEIRDWARGNRAFLMRVVQCCVKHGIRQFLDLGSGIPAVNHVHVTVRAIAPETRVAYVDFEPVAVAHTSSSSPRSRG